MAWPILLMLSSLAWRSCAVVAERLLLEEAPRSSPPLDRNSRLLDALLLVGGEDRPLGARLPFVHELDRPLLQLGTRRGVDETLDDEVAVAFEPFDLLTAQHVPIVGRA